MRPAANSYHIIPFLTEIFVYIVGTCELISIPTSFITSTALAFTCAAGAVPPEYTLIFSLNDCKKPCAIGLRQLFPVQRINTFMTLK